MKVHVTAKQSSGREWFSHLSIVEKSGRFFILHHSLPLDVERASKAEPGEAGAFEIKPLNPIGFESVLIDAVNSFLGSASDNMNSYVEGYVACKGMPKYSIFHGKQRY